MFTRTASLIVAAAISAAAFSAPATANAGEPEVAISYSDLDLNTQAGRDVLHRRVSAASSKICRSMGRTGPGDRCRSLLTQRTLAEVTMPTATAIAAR